MNKLVCAFLFCFSWQLLADGPADNVPDKVRPVPPPGVAVPDDVRQELTTGVAQLGQAIEDLREETKSPDGLALLPDAQIYYHAVRYALNHGEFFRTNEFATARQFLEQGQERVRLLRQKQAPWLSATGLVVRGYQSRIDGSVQPYGLVIPPSYRPGTTHSFRVDFWLHGRGENLSELSFIDGRQKGPGEFVPANAIVVHLYGRYCNGNRFAGETDLFETLAQLRKYYPIDENRLVVRGFSLGGAACWHLATHHAGLWAAAAPGAGFSETADFLKVFQGEKLQPSWFEQKLWHLYDATDYAVNLFNCPTVAYSGEIDKQKQAADMMVAALSKEGMELTHIIGPQTPHRYHPDSRKEINQRIDSIVARGRDPIPRQVRFVTYTLRYNQMAWVTVDGLERHWEAARVEAAIENDRRLTLTTTNVTALTLDMPAGLCPLDTMRAPELVIDGQKLAGPRPQSDRSWRAQLEKKGGTWKLGLAPDDQPTLRKRHGLQGPIDDAFMESFLIVRPTGKALNSKVGAWTMAEMSRATNEWRRQFRGEPRVKDDTEITPGDIPEHNLILWGDPASNHLLGQIANQLPLRWDAQGIHTRDAIYPPDNYVPILIYPNPLNPNRYVVVNSGFTFREYDYLNNARQTPKLPDYAVIDLSVPPNSRTPGGITIAGFFGEKWELRP